jgi:Pyridoxal/pyridoxine/pyridoxamine kinase
MKSPLPRIAAIHDLSGVGRCSLSVILPVISAMRVQVCAVPTAVLSTHTGGWGEVALRDLTEYISGALAHYKQLEIPFNCIYSGFLSSEEQFDLCAAFFAEYPNALIVVDPVMGDHGKPYRTYTKPMQKRMADLVAHADIITPNLTEACILLGIDYPHEPLTLSQAKSMLVRLGSLGPEKVIITGAILANGEMANLGYEKTSSTFWQITCDYVPASYPGTGDIFASVLTGSILTGDSLPIAMDRATQFLQLIIKTTYSYGTDPRHGVMFEKSLRWLTEDHLLMGYHPF